MPNRTLPAAGHHTVAGPRATPALTAAAALRALAVHLVAHPDLAPVDITGFRAECAQLNLHSCTAAAAVAWAQSLGATEARVHRHSGHLCAITVERGQLAASGHAVRFAAYFGFDEGVLVEDVTLDDPRLIDDAR